MKDKEESLSEKVCPKCGARLSNDYRILKGEKGCEYCNPTCRYCGKHYFGLLMQHHVKCKEFINKMKNKENIRR